MGVIIVREMVGTSPKSWSDAARQAVATAWRAASLHDRGLVPTISRTMITPTVSSFESSVPDGPSLVADRERSVLRRLLGQERPQGERVDLALGLE